MAIMNDVRNRNLWGGRFTGETDHGFAEFNRSFGFDRRLFAVDLRASIAHCDGLAGAGVLTGAESNEIKSALQAILDRGQTDASYFEEPGSEDVHSFVEARLVEMIGDTGRKLHTGRSRNDQVATDLRLWLRDEIDRLASAMRDAQVALLDLAEAHRDAVIPGYTHLQRAQPVLFAHWCLAYFEMLARDGERLADVRERANVLPLGSAALAGTSYPIDRDAVARALGSSAPTGNGDRFVLDLVKQSEKPALLLLNKTDRIKDKSKLLSLIEWYSGEHEWNAVVPISALKGDQVEQLLAEMVQHLPEGEPLFSEDDLTDQPVP